MSNFLKKRWFIIFMIALAGIKIVLVSNLPLLMYPNAWHDDALMVNSAASILSLDWLGPYSHMTMVKGPFFPFFLAASKALSLPYQLSATLLYLGACAVFVYGVKTIFKKRIYLAVLFAALAFNPISFSAQTFQRVYRNGMAPAQVLIIFGCLFALYLRREQPTKKLLPWMLGGGAALAALWLTREDGIWIIPFVSASIAITAGVLLHKFFKTKERKYIAKSALSLVPAVVLAAIILAVSLVNYAYYGIFTTNELNGSNFSKAIHSIYSVEPSEDIDFVSVPRSTVDKLYEVSPTLATIKPEFEAALDGWEVHGVTQGDGEVEDGWFIWCIRNAVAAGGYYSDSDKANTFYLNVHKDIQQAFSGGRLEKRFAMPSALMSPWKQGYGSKLISASKEAFDYVIGYNGTEVLLTYTDGSDYVAFERFEYITGGATLYADSPMSKSLEPGLAKLVSICNSISKAYQKSGAALFFAGLAAYLLISAFMIIRKVRRKRTPIDIWLVLTSILLSITVLIAGVSYTHISAYQGINAAYLSGAYPLITAFAFMAIMYCMQYLIVRFKERTSGR